MNRKLLLVLILFLCSTILWAESNYLRATQLNGNKLQLTFKFNLKDVNYFIIPAKGFTKHIYDVKNGVLPVGKTLPFNHPNVRAFRIGQYNKETLRIVIESNRATSTKHSISGKVLTIPIPSGKTLYSSSKRVKKRVKKNGYRVIVDAGHGGKDNGASCCSLNEKVVTLTMASKLKRKLEKKGYSVYMTRSRDKFISLIKRTEYANAKKADIFVSIHVNAAPAKKRKRLNGIEIFYLSTGYTKRIKRDRIVYKGRTVYNKYLYKIMTNKKKVNRSRQLGRNVQRQMTNNIRKGYGDVNSELKSSDFWVLLGTKMPSILVETGYLTHKKDRKRLGSNYYQNLVVKGIAEGIDLYFKGRH